MAEQYGAKVTWKGFELHPETPHEGLRVDYERNPYLARARENVRRLAGELGIRISSPPLISNSRSALEGAEYARDQGRFDAYHQAIFEAYFTEGRDIGDLEVLAQAADRCGLERESFLDAVKYRRYRDRIDASIEEAQGLFITAVPTFLIGKKRIIGAQPFEAFVSVLESAPQG